MFWRICNSTAASIRIYNSIKSRALQMPDLITAELQIRLNKRFFIYKNLHSRFFILHFSRRPLFWRICNSTAASIRIYNSIKSRALQMPDLTTTELQIRLNKRFFIHKNLHSRFFILHFNRRPPVFPLNILNINKLVFSRPPVTPPIDLP